MKTFTVDYTKEYSFGPEPGRRKITCKVINKIPMIGNWVIEKYVLDRLNENGKFINQNNKEVNPEIEMVKQSRLDGQLYALGCKNENINKFCYTLEILE